METNDRGRHPELPEGYFFDEHGLGKRTVSKRGGEQRRICCDSIPTDIEKVTLVDDASQTKTEGYRFSIERKDGNKSAPIVCTMKEMGSKKFLEKIFGPVIPEVYRGAQNEVGMIFEHIIKTACVGKKAVEVYANQFGWKDRCYIWDKPMEPDIGKEYASAVEICKLAAEHDVPIVALIGAVHGFMKKPLQKAGIDHDYVDVIVGPSGIGKSASLKLICNYHARLDNIYSVGSSRKVIRILMERNTDQTVVLDDFCKTKSDRVSAAQEQLVSEVIQASSDAARVVHDRDSKAVADPALRRHIMLSAERVIHNESTMNRCFLYNMEESLSLETFQSMKELEKEDGFYRFLVAISRFVGGDNYDCEVEKMAGDYKHYKEETGGLGTCTSGSDHRINETYAVQMVLARVIMRYLASLDLAEDLIKKAEKAFTDCIASVCRGMKMSINELHDQETYKQYLNPLAEIISQASDWKGQGYYVYKSEEKYRKHKEKERGCLLFCENDGYASFEGKCMCEILESQYGIKGANPGMLGRELMHYSLAHVDGEGKASCVWHTKHRYYHVRVSELLELICIDLPFGIEDYVESLFKKEQ